VMSRNGAVPGHLSTQMRTFYRQITRRYILSEHHRRLLVVACESWDRAEQARQGLATAGALVVTDRHGQTRAHPLVTIERDSRIVFARMLRELALSDGRVQGTARQRT
jgi:phage terminase small subunit